MEMALFSHDNDDVNNCSRGILSNLEYTDDISSLSEDPTKLQAFFDHLNDNVAIFQVRFPPTKCKTLLQDWNGPKPNLFLEGD